MRSQIGGGIFNHQPKEGAHHEVPHRHRSSIRSNRGRRLRRACGEVAMPRMVDVKSIFGERISVQEGTIFTRSALQQWYGWRGKGRPRPGLREQYRSGIKELEWLVGYIEKMIDGPL